jgi:hypothetical protein
MLHLLSFLKMAHKYLSSKSPLTSINIFDPIHIVLVAQNNVPSNNTYNKRLNYYFHIIFLLFLTFKYNILMLSRIQI